MSCFFFDFWVALGAPWDGLTCNPYTYMQSKHTFHFLYFFLKKASWRPSNESLFELFLTKYVIFVWKIGSKNCFKKRCPSRLKRHPNPMPGGSWRGSLTCALYRQETVVRAAVEALFEMFAEKSGLGSKLVWKTWVTKECCLLKTNAQVERKCYNNCWNKCTRLMIWHALGKGPAIF